MRRAGGFSTEDKLLRLYMNMSPEYKVYVRLDDITDVAGERDQGHCQPNRSSHSI